MQKGTTRKIAAFFIGLLIVSLLTVVGSLAFFSAADLLAVIRTVLITDAVFIVLYVVWIKLHKGYETIYKSGLKIEEEK